MEYLECLGELVEPMTQAEKDRSLEIALELQAALYDEIERHPGEDPHRLLAVVLDRLNLRAECPRLVQAAGALLASVTAWSLERSRGA
jgi:hypothetical protein